MTPDRVVMADGTSMANMLAMAALIAPGDEVLAEHPAYEPMLAAARFLGAEIRSFTRAGVPLSRSIPTRSKRALTPRRRLILLTNLHNPTGNLADETTARAVGAIAERVGAHVLIDEVYLDAPSRPAQRRALLGDRFVTTSSLTKVYGLSGLRCGWILAAPALAERMWRLNELFGVAQAHADERLSCLALARLDEIAAETPRPARPQPRPRQRLLRRPRRPRSRADDRRHHRLPAPAPRRRRRAERRACAADYDTSIVPGRFFGLADHFRIGIGGPTEIVEEGLDRLGAALDELA